LSDRGELDARESAPAEPVPPGPPVLGGTRRWFLAKVTALAGIAGGLAFGILRVFRSDPAEDAARLSSPLGEIAAAVLPSEVPADEARRAVNGFVDWLRLYREDVELAQFDRETPAPKSGPSPARRYLGQLRQLETEAVRRQGRPLGALEVEQVRALVLEALEESRAGVRTRAHRAGFEEHVVQSFLSFYFRSNDGVNRCSRAFVNPRSCQGWGSDDRPPPLPS